MEPGGNGTSETATLGGVAKPGERGAGAHVWSSIQPVVLLETFDGTKSWDK